ncbi:hypothetical protein [Chryseobacterium hagamense]|jgi:hypothetical protein|uniref:Uncharacterized protein n=1 Tax=Chryseobacterium hagamense TaxID=395935 RepID=A0A511YNZ9_9FLAO|nr:hypothetical protein [Chryseobacterium hagamense]GEN76921.1 hypothetical protein CHA01nite_26610 [Chryseobacterium hagamense]
MYTKIEQLALDIDWFFTDKLEIGFIASAGGKLPDTIAELGNGNQILSSYFRSLPDISEVIINPKLSEILQTSVNEIYLLDFINMAKKGLYSFDKTKLNDFLDTSYHLVAKPINSLRLNDLPQNILESLLKTKIYDKLEHTQEINVEVIK